MPSRVRQHTTTTQDSDSLGWFGPLNYPNVEYFWESNYPGSCSCLHWETSPNRITIGPDNTGYYFYAHLVPPVASMLPLINSQNVEKMNSLNWRKLPTSNQAGLIQVFAEIDETIAMFTLKFWKALSYGAIQWGILPTISDIISTARVVQKLSTDLSSFAYEDTIVVQNSFNVSSTTYRGQCYEWDGTSKIKKTGRGDLSFQSPVSIFLDRVGFHPDAATAWDLVPLSFLVDYVLPIGNYLESFRQGGWLKAMFFNGWTTVKTELNVRYYHYPPNGARIHPRQLFEVSKAEIFQRFPLSDVLTVDAPVPLLDGLSFQLPRLDQMFNLLYVALGSSTRLKK